MLQKYTQLLMIYRVRFFTRINIFSLLCSVRPIFISLFIRNIQFKIVLEIEFTPTVET